MIYALLGIGGALLYVASSGLFWFAGIFAFIVFAIFVTKDNDSESTNGEDTN